MEFNPTLDQKNALVDLVSWWKNPINTYFCLGGYAGTGKTSLIAVFRKIIHKLDSSKHIAFCAFTGKASQVLDNSLKIHEAKFEKDSVGTIHSLIYAPIVDNANSIIGWKIKSAIKADLIIVDEASMVDRQIWEDLLRFGIPILAVGDHGQLPPINPGFNLMSRLDAKLELIHRQAADNPIIHLSMLARETGVIPLGHFGDGVRKIDRTDYSSATEVEELMQRRADKLLVLTGYNQTRIKLNQQMRQFLGFESKEPVTGDKVICLKNNWEKGIYNGMLGKIRKIKSNYEVEIEMENQLAYEGLVLADQFGSASSMAAKIRKKDGVDLFDYGYALTVHKAQGSQAKSVLLFEERNKYMCDEDWRRWLYTGVTRAEEELMIVGLGLDK